MAYLVLATPPEDGDCFETVSPLMKFTVKDCDPDTGEPDSDQGYDDEYQLEDLEITFGDFIQVSCRRATLPVQNEKVILIRFASLTILRYPRELLISLFSSV